MSKVKEGDNVSLHYTGTLDDGTPAPADANEEDVLYPCAFRDASEIRGAR